MGASTSELIELFRQAGIYRPFRCAHCEARGNFVSGPHSHDCEVCGKPARWGWYTQPRCEEHRTAEQRGDG